MATVEQMINSCAAQIGISGTNNKFNQWYWGYPTYDANTYPWCAAFQSWNADQVGGLGFNPSASVSGIYNQLPRVADENVQRGDFVCYNWDGRSNTGWMDHIGIVEWFDHSTGYFGTIEGNTGYAAGGEVLRQTRYNYSNYFTTFCRPYYDGVEAPTPPSSGGGNSTAPLDVKYRVYSQKQGWLPEMVNHTDTGGSSDTYAGDGSPILYLSIEMPGWYQVKTQANGWLDRVYQYNPNDLVYGAAGDGSKITAIRAYYDTQNPDSTGWLGIQYAVANVGENFLPNMIDLKDTGGSGDDYAGNGGVISAFQAKLVRM